MKVFKYGARPAGEDIRAQMKLGRVYYNHLVEAENLRRRRIWGADQCPPPPHNDCKCEECKAHWKTLRDRAQEEPLLDLKPLRKEAITTGLHWGTYLKVEESFSAAWKKTKIWHTVRFRSWHQGGVAAVQIQKTSDPSRHYQLTPAPDPRTGRRAGQRHQVRIRIGSQKQKPIWSDPIGIELHRPVLGRPTWVLVTLKHEGDRERWSVQFVCRDVPPRNDLSHRGVVAIDVGWRRMESGGLRVAVARGDDGDITELLLPDRWLELAKRADRIRGVRANRANALIIQDPRFAGIRSPYGIIRRARELEIDIVAWARRDRHLQQYETGCRRRSIAKRREETRVWLRRLRRRYAEVVIKNSSHKQLKEKKDLPLPARQHGQRAAPGEIIEEIRKVFGRDGVSVVSARNTSALCTCGYIGTIGAELLLECEGCGATEDRDLRSTRNMLSLYMGGEGERMTARKTVARFVKRHVNTDGGRNASAEA